MRTIWKFPLAITEKSSSIDAPKGAKPVFVGIDPKIGAICIWSEVDWDVTKPSEYVMLPIKIYGTGHGIADGDKYLGSVITEEGFVWHLYLIGEKP